MAIVVAGIVRTQLFDLLHGLCNVDQVEDGLPQRRDEDADRDVKLLPNTQQQPRLHSCLMVWRQRTHLDQVQSTTTTSTLRNGLTLSSLRLMEKHVVDSSRNGNDRTNGNSATIPIEEEECVTKDIHLEEDHLLHFSITNIYSNATQANEIY